MMRVGLTGGIASGKSTVASRMAHDGAEVIDYDRLVHCLQEPGSPAIGALCDRFGSAILDDQGGVDRHALSSVVFGAGSSDALGTLNAIMHPLVFDLAAQRETQIMADGRADHLIVHDIPLLTEVYDELPFRFDHIVTVEAPAALRVERMMRTRGMSRAQALARIASQTEDRWRERISDVIIDGSTSIEQMFEQVDSLMSSWRREMEGN